MTVFAPSNPTRGSRTAGGFSAVRAAAEQRQIESQQRAADPTEQHVRFIRSRGYAIYRCSVSGGPHDRWRFCGRDIDADDVAVEAARIRDLMAVKAAPVSVPSHHPAASISPTAVDSGKPSPAASSGKHEKDPTMANLQAEAAYCKERGTTPARVRADMQAVKDRLGASGAADALGIGKSTFGNALSGTAGIGPSVLAGLYGATGAELLPRLLPTAPSPVDVATATDPNLGANRSSADGAHASVASATNSVCAVDGSLATSHPTLLPLRPALGDLRIEDLLNNARARRQQLADEIVAIDPQIDAVMRLANPLAV